jgi:iron complex transport system substrate-binding protein
MSMLRALLLSLCAFAWNAHAGKLVDDRGVTLELARPPQRIVTMLPSLTEVVCELDACSRLVGLDDFSNWPAQVRKLPRLGGLEDTNIERVMALTPDLVLLASSSRAVGRLESLGIKVATLEPKTLADLSRVWAQLAQVLEVPDGAARWQRLEAKVDAAAARLPAALRGTTVYFEVNSAPYAASEDSFIGELLARIGAVNVVPGKLGPFPKLNPEFVVRADPQVIMISDHDARALDTRPGWGRIRAVRDGRVCLFDAQQGDALVRPGPRMANAVQLMVDCLQKRGRQP